MTYPKRGPPPHLSLFPITVSGPMSNPYIRDDMSETVIS